MIAVERESENVSYIARAPTRICTHCELVELASRLTSARAHSTRIFICTLPFTRRGVVSSPCTCNGVLPYYTAHHFPLLKSAAYEFEATTKIPPL